MDNEDARRTSGRSATDAADPPLIGVEAQLHALVRASSDVIYRMSPDWNEMRQLDGRGFLTDAATPTVAWWDAYIYPEDQDHIRRVIEDAIAAKGMFELEHRVRRVDGTPGWTLSRAIPILDGQGEIVDWFGTAKDVTARRETEQRYRSLFETMGQGFCDIQLLRDETGAAVDQLYLELNPAYERLIGIPVARAKGRKASEVMPALEPWWTETFDRIAKQGVPERIEHEVVSLGRWFEVYVYPTSDDRLNVLYEDITARKRIEEADRRNRERQTFLLRLTDAIRPLGDCGDIQGETTRLLREQVNAGWCYYVDWDLDGKIGVVLRDSAMEGLPSLVGAHDVSDGPEFLQLLASGEVLTVRDYATYDQLSTRIRRNFTGLGFRSMIVAPLVKEGRLIASLIVGDTKIRDWSADEVSLVVEVAERTWAAIERDRAQAGLRASEARLAAAFESVPIGVAVIDMAGQATLANDKYRRFLPSGVIPSRDPSRTHRWRGWDAAGNPIDPSEFPGARALRGEPALPGQEMLYTDDDGREIWTSVATAPVRDASGEVICIVSFVADIDTVKRSADALRESEERLRQFGNASQDVLWIRDAEKLQWQYLTPAFEAIYGLSCEEALTGDNYRNWLDLIVPEDRDHAMTMIERVAAGEPVTFEYRVRRPKDGHIRWLRDTDFPITDDSGKVVRIGGIGHDATELHEAEMRFQSLLEGIPQLVWRAVGHGHWTWASPQWTAFTGQAEVASHDFGWLDRVHEDDREAAMTTWSHAIETGGFNVEYRLCRADGSYSWFSTRATPVCDDAGTIVEWLGTSTDIDGLRQLQNRQRILLAELQHRVRNIMAMIRSVARRTSQGPDTVADYIEHFEGRINAMARTQTLLTRAPGAGVDLQNLVRDELEAQSAKPHHYSCRGPDVALSPKAAEVLTLAVHELATNAVKYGALGTPDGIVNVEWSRERRADQEWLCLDWTELRVNLPADHGRRKGFGTELVTRRVPYELKGRGTMAFRTTGLQARIEFPLIPGHSILQTDASSVAHLGDEARA